MPCRVIYLINYLQEFLKEQNLLAKFAVILNAIFAEGLIWEVFTLKLTQLLVILVRISNMIIIKGGAFYGTKLKKPNINIVVMRINKIGEVANARPCYNCLTMMKAVGIKKVYYSISDNELICENVNNMISIHISATTRTLTINNNIKTRNEYYEQMLIKYFPNEIKKTNLELFIKYNLLNVLPNCNYEIKKSLIYIYNNMNICIKCAKIL
jgi:hypothetical protein